MTRGMKPWIVVVVFFTACGGEFTNNPPTDEPIDPLSGEFLAPKLPAPNIKPLRIDLPPVPQPPRVDQYTLALGEGGSMRVAIRDEMQEMLSDGYLFETWLTMSRAGDQVIVAADGLEIGVQDGALYATVGDTSLNGYPVVASEWYNVAVVVRGNEATFYLNGWLQDREFLSTETARLSGALVIGEAAKARLGFAGALENVRLEARPSDIPGLSVHTHNICTKHTVFAFDFDGPAHSVWAESDKRLVPTVCGVGVNANLTPPALLNWGSI